MKKLCVIVLFIALQSCFSADQIGFYFISAEKAQRLRQECSKLGITYDLNNPPWVAYDGVKKEFFLGRQPAYEYLLELKVQVFKQKSAFQRAQQEEKEKEIKRREQEKKEQQMFLLGYEADNECEDTIHRRRKR